MLVGGTNSTGAGSVPYESELDIDDVKEMLRSLLADRFKLATHMGKEPATVFALTADSPKMKLSPDTEHPVCAVGFVSDHLEVLYDLDIEAADRARELGIDFARTAAPNADPHLARAVATTVAAVIDQETA